MQEDPRFPGLTGALNTETVLHLLSAQLPECSDQLQILSSAIVDVRYRPGGPCWILYRLKVRDGQRRSQRVLMSGQVLAVNESPVPVEECLLEKYASVRNPIRTPQIYLPEIHTMMTSYPLDAALPGLIDAIDPSVMKKHLSRLWAHRGVRVLRLDADNRGYTPQARAAFSYEALCENKDTGEPETRRLIGKMHAKKDTARIFADTWALWRAGKQTVSLAPPVGYIGAIGLTLQEQVQGERLGGMVDRPGFIRRVRTTARELAALHKLVVPLSTRRKPSDEADGVHRWAGVLTSIRPDLERRIEQLRDRLAGDIMSRAVLSTPIHADFHHTNILVSGDRITIIDLDEMAFGDPMVDVGRFMASLRVPARRAFGDVTALDGAAETFLAEYLRRVDGDEKRARLFESAALLIAAGSSFRVQRENWQEETSILVAESEKKFASSHSTTVGTGDLRPTPPPVEDRAVWARDAMYMQAVLDPHIKRVYGAQLTRCRVSGKSSGSHLRYVLRGTRNNERWGLTLDGHLGRERGGRSFLARLDSLRECLKSVPNALGLPRPVAHIKPLSLLVWEMPSGTRFSSLMKTSQARDAAGHLAGALKAMHATPVDLDHHRTLAREMKALRDRLEHLLVARPDLTTRATEVMRQVAERFLTTPDHSAPVLRTLHPHHVLYTGERIAIDKLEDVTLAHPYGDAADFLARLVYLETVDEEEMQVEDIADHFRNTYLADEESGRALLSVFEAGALLRLACRHSGDDVPDRLLAAAEHRLAS